MEPTAHSFTLLLATPNRRQCQELRLVLDAAQIEVIANHQQGQWKLFVRCQDVDRASEELAAYHRENIEPRTDQQPAPVTFEGAAAGVVGFAMLMVLFAFLSSPWGKGWPLATVGRVDAEKVFAGEWWRCLTALTLHADAGHLLSNLAFGLVFGLPAGRSFGGGVAWLAILLAGAAGNFANVIVHPAGHLSMGSSTAIFAALGMLVAHALQPRIRMAQRPLTRWSPLIGGVVLLAVVGVGGERTDVAAHFTGFIAGMIIGYAISRMPNHWLARRGVQAGCGAAAFGVVAASWVTAVVAAS